MHTASRNGGFTVAELAIAVVVIGVLASLILGTLSDAKERARVAKAKNEINLIQTAVLGLELDLGKWPNGCSTSQQPGASEEVRLGQEALTKAPTAGTVSAGCTWTNEDIKNWDGPYVDKEEYLTDVWENNYVFESEYYPWKNCPTTTDEAVISAVVSYGPDQLESNL